MVTVSHLVEDRLSVQPFLQEALAKGIINYGALADLLLPEIKKELKKEVKHAAVMMALRRYAERLEREEPEAVLFFRESDLHLHSNLCEINAVKSPDTLARLKELYAHVDFKKGEVLNVIQGNYEITIICNERHKKEFVKILGKEHIIRIFNESLSSLSIKFSEEILAVPGFVYVCVKALAWNQINIVEVVSTMTELTFILEKEDAVKAYKILQKLISEEEL